MESKGTLRKHLRLELHKEVLKQPKYQQKYPPERRLALAFIVMALKRIEREIWLPHTAHSEMKKASAWMEATAPGSTELSVWKEAKSAIYSFHHKLNKAPLLSWGQLLEIAESCASWRHRAIFWLGVMTCSRIGNLHGMVVEEITPTHARTLLIRHKTASKVNQMSLTLPYWNTTMQQQVHGFIEKGEVTKKEMAEIEKALKLNDARKHSIRRTSCNVYADCLVPLDRIAAITKHTSQAQLLEYIGNFNPIVDSSVPTGMAISHAPHIWRAQNIRHEPIMVEKEEEIVLLKAGISTRRSSARRGAASLPK